MKKAKAYKWIRVAGLLSLLPIIMAAAPMAGYWSGEFLTKRFAFPRQTTIVCVIIGFAAGLREAIRIIRAALKSVNNPD